MNYKICYLSARWKLVSYFIDENECLSDPCHTNANCTDTIGSYLCECDDGYTGDGWNCTNIQECDSSPCDANANCTDTDGSYGCTCDPGYTGDGWNCSG